MSDIPESGTVFASVVEFVEKYLSQVYARDVNNGFHMWCPSWWMHPEAVARLDSLWRSWEYHRMNSRTGLSDWWTLHADPHMRELLHPEGPFKVCSARGGHRDSIKALPLTAPPEGMFDNPKPYKKP